MRVDACGWGRKRQMPSGNQPGGLAAISRAVAPCATPGIWPARPPIPKGWRPRKQNLGRPVLRVPWLHRFPQRFSGNNECLFGPKSCLWNGEISFIPWPVMAPGTSKSASARRLPETPNVLQGLAFLAPCHRGLVNAVNAGGNRRSYGGGGPRKSRSGPINRGSPGCGGGCGLGLVVSSKKKSSPL